MAQSRTELREDVADVQLRGDERGRSSAGDVGGNAHGNGHVLFRQERPARSATRRCAHVGLAVVLTGPLPRQK